MQTTIIEVAGTDLNSRASAAELRAKVEACALTGGRAALHLGLVRSMTPDYADELAGELASRHGLKWVFDHIRFEAAAPAVVQTIVNALRDRLQAQYPDVGAALTLLRQALEKQRPAA
jgi:hypothetical protein